MIRPGPLLALLALLAAPAFAEHSPAAEIPGDLMSAVTRARYAVRFETEAKIPAVSNYAQDLRARFGDEGIEVALRGKQIAASPALGIRLSRVGRDGGMKSPGRATRHASDSRVEYRYEGITEWWLNSPRGLEQGFTIAEPPAGDREWPLILDLEITPGWHAERAGDAVRLIGSSQGHLRYGGLTVIGADGAAIEAGLSVCDGAIRITVEDRLAVYPIVVDPLLTNQEAKLIGSSLGGDPGALLGLSVALEGDTALVGVPVDDTGTAFDSGSAYVFVRTGTSWSEQALLLPSDGATDDEFGSSVALSGDTALVSAPADDNAAGTDVGSAYIFVRSGTTWSEQVKLLGAGATAGDHFGNSVALDGDTALVGASRDDTAVLDSVGSAYVFVRVGTIWNQQDYLTAEVLRNFDSFGRSVALRGDTALIGANEAAYVFVRSGISWTQQVRLVNPGVPVSGFGDSVALSGDTALVGASFGAGSAFVFIRSGTSWGQQARLVASDAATGQAFGRSVALSGDVALVGAPSGTGVDPGSVYVFARSGTSWSEQRKLLSGDGETRDYFGTSVALSGETALVGAPGDDTAGGSDAGSAYVFFRSGPIWDQVIQQAQFLASGPGSFDGFGFSVAVSGDTALVGAPQDDVAGKVDAGSAYVFNRNGTGWTQQAQLLADDGEASDLFGRSVALSGDTALIGAPVNGSAYVFTRSGTIWTQRAHLLGSANFGNSVALSGSTALIGASQDNTTALLAGSAYVFVGSGTSWSQQGQLLALDGVASDALGSSVALHGDTAVVGAPGYPGTPTAGSAYVFTRSGMSWSQQAKLLASDGATQDRFGDSVAISGDTALVGAPEANHNVGATYVFTRSGANWSEQDILLPGAGGDSFGTSVALSGNTALVGAPGYGSAYVFFRSGTSWTQQAQLLSDDLAPGDLFGRSVALSGDTALVSALVDDTPLAINGGSAYVFRLNMTPSITAAGPLARRAGNLGTRNTIATISDYETPAGSLTMAATSVPPGIFISGISNSNGTISAQVRALCDATVGANSVVLQVQDGSGATATGTLTVEVTPNLAPTLGNYPDTSMSSGESTLVSPSAPPSDNVFVGVTAFASAGFTGTISASPATGAISIGNANSGTHTITVRVTDNCSATTTREFTLTVEQSQIRGDADGNGVITAADILYLLHFLFGGGPPPATACGGDADADTAVTIMDPFFLINHLFFGSPAPTPCP